VKTRIVIIDDEVFVRKGIISSISWDQYDIELIGESSDGKSGLELIRKHIPDIVITDIRMPNMDGLEMIRLIRQELPHIKILILSVLDDFSTIREALRLGVNDYINKLTEPEELLRVVLNLKNTIDQSDTSSSNIQNQVAKNGQNHKLEDWLLGTSMVDDESLRESNLYQVGILSGNQMDYSEIQSILKQSKGVTFSLVEELELDHFLFFISGIDAEYLENAVLLLHKNYNKSSIGLSKIFGDVSNRKVALEQAIQANEYRFHRGDGHVILYQEVHPSKREYSTFFESQSLKDYQVYIEGDATDKADDAFNKLFPIAIDESIPPQSVRDSVYQWLSTNIMLLRDWGGNLEGMLQGQSPFEQIQQFKTYFELREWCYRLHLVIQEMLQAIKSSKSRFEIQKAIEYLKIHYMDPLRVQDIASLVNLSENYFSNLFTKETGKTFTHYLQETRVEKSKELLRNRQADWVEVGAQVGFEDPKYFSKIFKRYVGLTPVQFQNGKN